jgi:broad specificity phosphatase PhoE
MQAHGAKVLWIEVNSEDEKYLQQQYLNAFNSPDYAGVSEEDAERDYRHRIDIFRSIYEPFDDEHSVYSDVEKRWSYIKCDHSQQHFVIHHVKGYLFQKVANFIMNLRTTSHAFYLTRHGQSEYNDLGRIGGDSGLTEHGIKYAQKLAEFVDQNIVKDCEIKEDIPARLWTSTMRRTKETAQFIKQNKIVIKSEDDPTLEYEWVQMRPRAWHHLDELFAGSCDGMTYEEIEERFPEEWERRNVDKLAYRYPRGESYLDVIARLEPIIIEMERHQEPLVIIAHQGILRIIYAFYMGLSRSEAPYVSIPLNTVVQLIPRAYDCLESRHLLYRPEITLPHDGQTEMKKKNEDDPQSH